MTNLVADLKRHATAGVRTLILLNLASLPLSFATNMILGRVSVDALGYYSAISVVIGTYYTFFVLGGSLVFTRFVPALPTPQRLSFLLTYTTIVVFVLAGVSLLGPQMAPRLLERALHRFGGPPWLLVVVLLFVSVLWGMATYFLYGTLKPARAFLTERTVVLGFFGVAVIGSSVWREALSVDPSRFIWFAGLGVHAAGALVGMVLIACSEEARRAGPIRWSIPQGFWPMVFYTHISTVVNYAYSQLVPTFVLFWIDVAALGQLHAASRYVLLLGFIPTAVVSVLAPSTARLEAAGFRREALGHAASAVNVMLLYLVPAVLALILFAGDAMAVFGPAFRDHRRVLSLLAIGALGAPIVELGTGVAAALRAMRTYLAASVVYVTAAVALAAILVPSLGLTGAALAATLGAAVRQGTIVIVLRRLGFPRLRRLGVAWMCAASAAALAVWRDPQRPEALVEWLALTLVFAWLGRIKPDEMKLVVQRLFGRISITAR